MSDDESKTPASDAVLQRHLMCSSSFKDDDGMLLDMANLIERGKLEQLKRIADALEERPYAKGVKEGYAWGYSDCNSLKRDS